MTKSNRPYDLADLYGIEWQARQMRAEAMANAIRSAGRAIGQAMRKLDMWFEAARELNTANPYTFADVANRRYHIPAIFGRDPERVLVKPANDDQGKAAA